MRVMLEHLNNIPVSLNQNHNPEKNREVEFRLCPINSLAGDTAIFRELNSDEPLLHGIANSLASNRKRRHELQNYEEGEFSLVGFPRTIRTKMKSYETTPNTALKIESGLKKRFSTDVSDYRQPGIFTRLKTHTNKQLPPSRINLRPHHRSTEKSSNLSPNTEGMRKPQSILLARRKKRMGIKDLISQKNQKQQQYEKQKCFRFGVIPHEIDYSSARAKVGKNALIKTMGRQIFSDYKVVNNFQASVIL